MNTRAATFGDICEFKYGKSLAADNRIPGDVVVYGSNGPVGTHNTPLSTGPTIVIGRKGSVGEVHYCQGPNWAIDTTYFIDATATDCDLKWLSHALSSSRIRELNKAAAVPGLNRNDAYRENVLVPPLDEQKRIAAILDKADQLRQKRRQTIALLESLTQSIFLEMFGDPVSNPKAFPIVEFGSLIKSGPTNGLYKPARYYGEGTRILRINNFYDGTIVGIDKLRRLDISPKEREVYSLSENDIVINRVNSREYIGKSALVPALDEPIVFESNMMRLSLRGSVIDPKYCIDILQSQSIKQQIARKAKDAVNQSSINQSDVKSFKLMLPPIAKQHEYARIALASSTQRGVLVRALAEDNQLFSSLQHRASTGQL